MDRRGYALLGMFAPVFFIIAVALMGYIKPDYSHVYHTISELGETGSVTASITAYVFIVTGVMIIGFGIGLHQILQRSDRRVWAGVLVIMYGLLDFVGSGVFPVDVGGASGSLVSTIHVYATMVGELAAFCMPIWFLKDTEGISKWKEHRNLTRVVFFISLPLIVFLAYCIDGHTPSRMDTPIGLAQRLFVGLFIMWIAVTAYRMR